MTGKVERLLSHQETRKFYDAFGEKQDKQFYERVAVENLLRYGAFQNAEDVFEFGCGTGKLAHTILSKHASKKTNYIGIDISQTMVNLSRKRLAKFEERVTVYQTDGTPVIHEREESFDTFVSTYVFDLLDEHDIEEILKEAHRILRAHGNLCLAGLTHGVSVLSRLVEKVWLGFYRLNPSMVGGCRPIKLTKFLSQEQWQITYNSVVTSYGVASEVVIAKKRQDQKNT